MKNILRNIRKFFTLLGLVLITILPTKVVLQSSLEVDYSWSPSERVSYIDQTFMGAQIATDTTGNSHILWYQYYVKYSYKAVGGQWTTPIQVNDVDYSYLDSKHGLSIAVDADGNVYGIWTDSRNGVDDPDIYFSYKPSSGDWQLNHRVNDDGGTSDQYVPKIAVDAAGNAYTVWSDYRNDPSGSCDYSYSCDGDIYFAYRPAGGTWGTNIKISDDVGTSEQTQPDIAVDEAGNVFVVWVDKRNYCDIYFTYRPAGGDWEANIKISDDNPLVYCKWSPSIAVDGAGNAYAVWSGVMDSGFDDIFFAYRPAGGEWGANIRVNDDSGDAMQSGPSIAVDDDGNAYAVWSDERNGNEDVLDSDVYSAYRPVGGEWGTNVRVNEDNWINLQWSSDIAMDQLGNAYTAWSDFGGSTRSIWFASTIPRKPWTMMFYLDGDNNLDSNYIAAFNQLESAADNLNVNILVAWDRLANGDSAYYKIQYDTDLDEINPSVDYIDNVNKWSQNELYMNDPTTLSDFVNWARTNYPAHHYALIISNHGTGLGGLATDAGSGGDWLTVREWSSALRNATSEGINKIDVVYADACMMAMIEDAYQIRDYTDFFVASENLIWITVNSTSGPYDNYVSSILETTSPRDLAIALSISYRDWLDTDYPSAGYTISTADLAKLSDLVTATNGLASVLNEQMSTYASEISSARASTQKFDSTYNRVLTQDDVYIDLYDFASEVKNQIASTIIQDEADGVMNAIQAFVITEAHKDGILSLGGAIQSLNGSHGVSIFFPPNASSFYNSANYDFAVGATWPESTDLLTRTQADDVEWGSMLVNFFNETQPGGLDTKVMPSPVSPIAYEISVYLPLVISIP